MTTWLGGTWEGRRLQGEDLGEDEVVVERMYSAKEIDKRRNEEHDLLTPPVLIDSSYKGKSHNGVSEESPGTQYPGGGND